MKNYVNITASKAKTHSSFAKSSKNLRFSFSLLPHEEAFHDAFYLMDTKLSQVSEIKYIFFFIDIIFFSSLLLFSSLTLIVKPLWMNTTKKFL
jgi:hypothetical protein